MSDASGFGGGLMSEAPGAGSTGRKARTQHMPKAFEKSAPAGKSGTHFFAWNEGPLSEPKLDDETSVF